MNSLLNAYKEMETIAETLEIPNIKVNRAKEIFTQVREGRHLKGRSNNTIASACLYVACRIEGEEAAPRTLQEIWEEGKHGSLKEMSTCVKVVVEKIKTPLKNMAPTDYIPRLCSRLNLPNDVQLEATHVAGKTVELRVFSSSHKPIAVAAASVFMASQVSAMVKTRKQVAKVAGVCEATVKTIYQEMRPHAFELFPEIRGQFPLLDWLPKF